MNNLFRNIPPVTKNLLIINVLVWLACAFLPKFGAAMSQSCALHYFLSPDFRFWQPITYMFMHADFTHLLFNMFGVLMFGAIIERVFGSGRYLLFYITVGIGAALVQEGVYAAMISHYASALPADITATQIAQLSVGQEIPRAYASTIQEIYYLINIPTLGASGSLYGVLLAFAMIFPNMPMYIFFIPMPIKAKWVVLGYGVMELTFGLTGMQSGVAHFAHLGGMLIAFILIVYWRKKGEINRGPLY